LTKNPQSRYDAGVAGIHPATIHPLPSMNPDLPHPSRRRGMTLIEILVVVAILAILAGLLVPGLGKAKEAAEAAKMAANVKQIAVATINFAADNGGRLPSPQYPGGMRVPPGMSAADFFPRFHDLGPSGLWLDGVIFAELYLRENQDGEITSYQVDDRGTHLRDTLFESTISVKRFPNEEDWHRHSYAMNANLQFDRIYNQIDSGDPFLTEKTLDNLLFKPNAMLYIDCMDTNVVRYEDFQSIIDTINQRWQGGKAIVGFLDGHVERLSEREIPRGNPNGDREASRFWRGVDPN
jgi:prepilin-type N-terminal cleavage/methylation domain-containing protein/prepilin-type processing-associated H-X9-DG protein